MYVKVRNCANLEEFTIQISKAATIATLKKEIENVIKVKSDLQKLYFSGKHLEGDSTLFDYKINVNDMIQLMIKNDIKQTSSLLKVYKNKNDINNDNESKTDETNEDDLIDAESDYYIVGDPIDCIDEKYGAWFEASIVKICRKNNELIYIVKWDFVEYAQSFQVNEESIRPRAQNIISEKELTADMKVMINHNLENPSEIGHWYDFKVKEIIKKRAKTTLIGTLFVGKETSMDSEIILRNKIYAIEKPTLLTDRKQVLKNISNRKRIVAPDCWICYDKSSIKCKECGCKICGGKDNPHLIILCDECEDEYHIKCLNPPLTKIPENDWYCPNCKNDENEIIRVGTKVTRARKVNVKENERDWGRGLACVGRSKQCTIVQKNHRGPIPGIEVGTSWWSRIQVSEAGVHIPPVAGIHGREKDCAYSIVLSGGYGDIDNGLEFIYTGSGGRDLSGNKRTAKQSSHQTLTRANKALALNCRAKFNDKEGATALDWRAGTPVRVIRNYKLSKFSKYAPTEGNRYDGLYKVVKYYPELNEDGYRLWRFLLRRDDPLPPPWTPEGKKRILDLGLQIQYPEGYDMRPAEKSSKIEEKSPKMENLKNKKNDVKDKQQKKKLKVEPYILDSNVADLIYKDVVNSKLWQECKTYLPSGKVSFLNQVSKSLQCVCCQELVFKPVTTPCAHNICQRCLKRSISAGVNFCPTCRFSLGNNYKILINKELAMILILLFPGYEGGRK